MVNQSVNSATRFMMPDILTYLQDTGTTQKELVPVSRVRFPESGRSPVTGSPGTCQTGSLFR